MSLKHKNKLYKKIIKWPTPEKKLKYIQYRNKLHHLIRISKRRHYKEKFEQTQGNISKIWNLINEVIN